jgi:glycogen phosphorylase
MPLADKLEIAYFSMEIELEPDIPTYSGGLGVLAGDMLRSAADLGVPMVAVTLVHRKGYFRQKLDAGGQQSETDEEWSPEARLERLDAIVPVIIEGREVHVQAWKYTLCGADGHEVPVILLDTQVPGNSPSDAALTDHLYGDGESYRLCQEAVLGLGGIRMLSVLGLQGIRIFHMNEGHSSLLTLALLERQLAGPRRPPTEDDINIVRKQCVFTTHTPVPAALDKFSASLVRQILGEERVRLIDEAQCWHEGALNMTYLGLRFSHYINGVAMHHGEVSRGMFPEYPVHAITNGVHPVRWTSPAFQKLYDRHIPEWRRDSLYLRYAVGIAAREIGETHREAKRALLAALRERAGASFDENTLTIGFARRATQYKRLELLFSDLDRLRSIARQHGPLQIVYGGKAHPNDQGGKAAIRSVFQAAAALRDAIPVVYVENYDARWGALLTSGVDLWLNTPHRPLEASGTSGMKAALNGVPSLSILDGWWIEGCIEGVTGWAIGSEALPVEDHQDEVDSMYDKLEHQIVPMYYGAPQAYYEVMRSTIALNGSFFNTERMLRQYVANAYYAVVP